MADIDPISLGNLLNKKSKIKYPLGYDIFENVRGKLSHDVTEKIMVDLGKYLGELHKLSGKRYGPIKPELLDSYELVGTHDSWYDFLFTNFNDKCKEMDEVLIEEKRSGKYKTKLSDGNRELMYNLLSKKDDVVKILNDHKVMLNTVIPKFLNGNVYAMNIILDRTKFVGLIDFHQSLLGDPVDELAYFSVMDCDKYLESVLIGWNEKMSDKDLVEKLHLYRLLECYRKIIRRYVKYQSLEDHSEPLRIAAEELNYYNSK